MMLGESTRYFSIVANVVKTNDESRLDFKEKIAIILISYLVIFVQQLHLIEHIVKAIPICESEICSDILMVIMYLLTCFVYCFLSCALGAILVFLAAGILLKMHNYISNKTKLERLGNYFVAKVEETVINPLLLLGAIDVIAHEKIQIKIITILFMPLILAVESVLSMLAFSWAFFVYIFAYLVIIKRFLGKGVIKLLKRIQEVSDRRVVGLSYRAAIIASLIIIVVYNRYQPIFELSDKSTVVLEFLASAIIIPVAFEWISSRRSQKNS